MHNLLDIHVYNRLNSSILTTDKSLTYLSIKIDMLRMCYYICNTYQYITSIIYDAYINDVYTMMFMRRMTYIYMEYHTYTHTVPVQSGALCTLSVGGMLYTTTTNNIYIYIIIIIIINMLMPASSDYFTHLRAL